MTKQLIHLDLKDILIGRLTPLFNYLLLIGICGRVEGIKNFQVYKDLNRKYETEKYIGAKNNNLDLFRKKWTI